MNPLRHRPERVQQRCDQDPVDLLCPEIDVDTEEREEEKVTREQGEPQLPSGPGDEVGCNNGGTDDGESDDDNMLVMSFVF